MNDIYSDMRNVATSLLGEFKQGVVQYVSLTPGSGPASNPGEPIETLTTIDTVVRGVSAKYVDGTNIVQSDKQVTFAPVVGLTPTIKDFVNLDGVKYKIIAVKNKPEAGTPVVHTLILRK